MGIYDVQTTYLHVEGIYTNTTQVDAYRGAGRPEAIYVLERAMDMAARELGVDRWDLRRRNFIPADRFPYRQRHGRDSMTWAISHRVLARAERDCRSWRVSPRASAASAGAGQAARAGSLLLHREYPGRSLGRGEGGIRHRDQGRMTPRSMSAPSRNGQGHETVYAQFLSDQTGMPAELIEVVQGDSDLIAQGGGTGGSRSVTTQANATLATVDVMIDGACAPIWRTRWAWSRRRSALMTSVSARPART